MKLFTTIIALLFLVNSGICFAGSPKGLQKHDENPKGFSQGDKTGWEGERPKGWDNLSGKEKEEWLLKHGDENGKEGKLKNTKNEKQKKSKKKNKKK